MMSKWFRCTGTNCCGVYWLWQSGGKYWHLEGVSKSKTTATGMADFFRKEWRDKRPSNITVKQVTSKGGEKLWAVYSWNKETGGTYKAGKKTHAKVINGSWRADPLTVAEIKERAKPWSVAAGHGQSFYCDTLSEAKEIGEKLARKNGWKNKWNSLWDAVRIYKALSPGYVKLFMYMPVPVRGSGVRYDEILKTMKSRGEPAFQWKEA